MGVSARLMGRLVHGPPVVADAFELIVGGSKVRHPRAKFAGSFL